MRFLLKLLVLVMINMCTFAADSPVMTRGFSDRDNISYSKKDDYYMASCPGTLSSTDCVAIVTDICRREGLKFINTGPIILMSGSGRDPVTNKRFDVHRKLVNVYCE